MTEPLELDDLSPHDRQFRYLSMMGWGVLSLQSGVFIQTVTVIAIAVGLFSLRKYGDHPLDYGPPDLPDEPDIEALRG